MTGLSGPAAFGSSASGPSRHADFDAVHREEAWSGQRHICRYALAVAFPIGQSVRRAEHVEITDVGNAEVDAQGTRGGSSSSPVRRRWSTVNGSGQSR